MLLGVDFGTTRTVVAFVDRGNYPVVAFADELGDTHEFFPTLVAATGQGLVYGFEAAAAGRAGAPVARSFKRALAATDATLDSHLRIGDTRVPLLDVLTGFFTALREALVTDSSVSGAIDGELHAVVSVPAHALGVQRFLTLEAYRRAGFIVDAMLNEPSAAGFEYTHRQARTISSVRNRVLVYDLGGGTFDSSLVSVDGVSHEVLGSAGVNLLGGDDFDDVLAELALALAGANASSLGEQDYRSLLDNCREAKERIAPQSKRIVLDVGDAALTIPVADFYEAARPLVERTLAAMVPLIGEHGELPDNAAGIYLVGGGSGLPLVPRTLRARFGRRVHRSPYPAASTAIGLAIAADPTAGFSLRDRLSRGFGVFRELRAGQAVGFDQIITRDQELDLRQPVVVTRRYLAAHNVGWFRFMEFSAVNGSGEPTGDLAPFAEVRFPFDPALQQGQSLDGVAIERRPDGPLVEETYTIDPHGIVAVRIQDLDTGYAQERNLLSASAKGTPDSGS